MSMTVPVVRIRVAPCAGNEEGITEINKSDYDPEKHQLVDDGKQPSLDLNAPKPAAAPGPFQAP